MIIKKGKEATRASATAMPEGSKQSAMLAPEPTRSKATIPKAKPPMERVLKNNRSVEGSPAGRRGAGGCGAEGEQRTGQEAAHRGDRQAASAAHPPSEGHGHRSGGAQEAAACDGSMDAWPCLSGRPPSRLLLPVAHDLRLNEAA
eukprot:CAMPEP_0204593276 /NCGR_PEP_ID=MMETSP0661-20131031/51416_1 /ASSEMBLY_ACC=CAM_ASM_000606 /TAXON_ID=109239 /ORGANISM="Alexandrium margalefi, Strain AMGDE01CS-322" /LENGTH=144 /DNA_ID=CAMNT_0051603571 /DNA_START=261 /DNA_END=692 /DNA_ORIENTATION=+